MKTAPEGAVEELGGAVHILPYLHDLSTTSIIERIRGAYRVPISGVGGWGLGIGASEVPNPQDYRLSASSHQAGD